MNDDKIDFIKLLIGVLSFLVIFLTLIEGVKMSYKRI